ncbi:hypothetical protein Pmani_029284 [Petrolisthes manimaculis]|uniref:Uncharacterized protein n=1 Tax=Petrolisthes manimaculis TaxID=1843537 RepID=A0AAE1NZR1_9EUCA|nr:hypothetical protein Pmani_029284 [Petrolisthes manimaculis]
MTSPSLAAPGNEREEQHSEGGSHGGHGLGYVDFGHSGFSDNNYYLGGFLGYGQDHGGYARDHGSQGHGYDAYGKGHGQDDDEGDDDGYGKGHAYSHGVYGKGHERDDHDGYGKGQGHDDRDEGHGGAVYDIYNH